MKNSARIEIGSLVVHQPAGMSVPHHADLGPMVEKHLQQLLTRRGAPGPFRHNGTLQIDATGSNFETNLAAAIAHELYRAIRGGA